MAGLECTEILGQTVGLCRENRCGFERLPRSATVFDLRAQVQVKTGSGQVEWGVRPCENEAASVENG
jgi:hypothetical protein